MHFLLTKLTAEFPWSHCSYRDLCSSGFQFQVGECVKRSCICPPTRSGSILSWKSQILPEVFSLAASCQALFLQSCHSYHRTAREAPDRLAPEDWRVKKKWFWLLLLKIISSPNFFLFLFLSVRLWVCYTDQSVQSFSLEMCFHISEEGDLGVIP